MRFLVRIYRQGKDYSAMVPDVPGCVAAADSVEEVRELIAEALQLHLEMMGRSKERVPTPARHVDLDVSALEKDELCTWIDVKAPRARKRTNRKATT